jgi:hypothetical protein
MVLPSLVCTIAMVYHSHCHSFPAYNVNWILPPMMFGLFYSVTIPCIPIYTKGKALFCGETENESDDREAQSAWNLEEIVLEALPQVRDIAINNSFIYII